MCIRLSWHNSLKTCSSSGSVFTTAACGVSTTSHDQSRPVTTSHSSFVAPDMARGSSPVHGSCTSSSRFIGAWGKPFVRLTFAGIPMGCALELRGWVEKNFCQGQGTSHMDRLTQIKDLYIGNALGITGRLLLVQAILSNKTSQN